MYRKCIDQSAKCIGSAEQSAECTGSTEQSAECIGSAEQSAECIGSAEQSAEFTFNCTVQGVQNRVYNQCTKEQSAKHSESEQDKMTSQMVAFPIVVKQKQDEKHGKINYDPSCANNNNVPTI